MARNLMILSWLVGLASFVNINVYGTVNSHEGKFSRRNPKYDDHMRKYLQFKAFLFHQDSVPLVSSAPTLAPAPKATMRAHVYPVTSYGADPTGKSDSTEAILKAIANAFQISTETDGSLMEGIPNLGGAQIFLEGGTYLISRPLRIPAARAGNLMIHGGTLRASDDFPADGFLIDLSANQDLQTKVKGRKTSIPSYSYEYISLKSLMLDCNYRGGGISVVNSLRTTIDNCYIAHFRTSGILVQKGHETYIRNCFLGQHITAGKDKGEKDFTGIAINLMGNDNAVTDVVIFSAAIGVMVSGQANTLSGVHCYNKATAFGGAGIYLKLPKLTQTRIVNCYLDYTGIIAEDPVLLHISSSFFFGDANVHLKSINGVAKGVTIVDNMFSGSNKGVNIVQLDETIKPFKEVDQVVVDRNVVKGMNVKATAARGSVKSNGKSWKVDFNRVLLFPDMIKHVQYSFSASSSLFPNHALRNSSQNRVLIESDVAVHATVFVTVDQAITF